MHCLDEGPARADPVLMLHGEPTWGFLYRKLVGPVVAAGHRVIAPDLIGFGRWDKPAAIAAHSYAFHVEAIKALLSGLELSRITLVCQDWGSLNGLRVAAECPGRFARIQGRAAGQSHVTTAGAGYFVKEEKGEQLAEVVNRFIRDNPG